MNRKQQNVIVRKYEVDGTTYIVKASVKTGVTENAAAKIRRLIGNEIRRQQDN